MNPIYRICRLFLRWTARILFRARIEGIQNVPLAGGFILASNHISYCDPPLVGIFLKRELFFMAKKELFDIWGLGALIRNLNSIPIKRDVIDRRALELGIEQVHQGYGLAIFPEGTRARDDELLPGRAGVGKFAFEASCPIIPTYVYGANQLTRCFLGLKKLGIVYGEQIPAEWVKAQSDSKIGYQQIADEIMRRIQLMKVFHERKTDSK